ncbi:hypothetical protein OESDEN_18393 [Oesophagostomum dentatum]|uniref:Uncharacterized protein n=1 Tax=Oesophagostomum dentatum TaxID=61180 RepID=A0A0B1S9E1_OESDE|nr:hypothetical protein OESDEN_18393 [Oesophagostomum dentatum]
MDGDEIKLAGRYLRLDKKTDTSSTRLPSN